MGLNAWSGGNRHAVNVPQSPIDGVALHELQSAWGDSGLKNATYRGACYLSRRKGGEQRQMMARVGNQADHNLGDYGQGSLRAHHELGKVVSRAVFEGVGAGPDDLATGQNHFEVKHVGPSHAILHGLGSASVVGHVASHGAAAPRRGVGRIKQSLLLACLVKHLVDDSRLDDRLKVGRVDFKNTIEALHAQGDSAMHRNSPAAQAGAGRCGRHGNECFVGPAQQERDLLGS